MGGIKKRREFYDWLQVSPHASQEVIDAAYRAIMRQAGNVEEEVIEQAEKAYNTLHDLVRRAEYDEDSMHMEGVVIDGRYLIKKLIASGQVTDVYLAEDLNVDESVCIRHCSSVSKNGAAMLLNEAKALWNLRHHSLPSIRGLLRLEDGTVAIAMSYIPGPTWAEMIEKNGAMHPEQVTWLAERVLNVLRFIYLKGGLIHGDVNPYKIIIQPETVMAVLVGFEFCLIKPDASAKSKGHSEIFSPVEAIQGMPLLPESDLYGLGKTMLYALNGDLEETRKNIVPESTPDPLCHFIKWLVTEDVLDRLSWEKGNLCDMLYEIKTKCFGKKTRIKPISWQKKEE